MIVLALLGDKRAASIRGDSPMIVGFDTYVLADRFEHHGTHVYAKRLLSLFHQLARESGIIFKSFTSPGNGNFANTLARSPHFEPVPASLLSHRILWGFGGASVAGKLAGVDLLYSPSYAVVPVGLVPVVCTIHDASALRSPHVSPWKNCGMRFETRAAAKRSRRIVTDSQWTRNDLLELYRLPPEKVVVAYPGYDAARFHTAEVDREALQNLLQRLGIKKRYLLHHGVVQPRKNLVRLIEAYRQVLARNRNVDPALVIAGPLGWNYEDVLKTARAGGAASGEVIFTGALPDEEMALLVKGAHLCVIPSLYEGFCLPMVEAMASGVPTIVSKASCLPEVSQGALRYFDPLSVEEMAAEIEGALENNDLRLRLSQAGAAAARGYSWEACARQVLQVLLEAGSQGKH